MVEAEHQLTLTCKTAEQVSPYFHPRVRNGEAADGLVAYVARSPAPAPTSEQWAAEYQRPDGYKRPQ